MLAATVIGEGPVSFFTSDGKQVTVPLSAFRQFERLPGASHPVVYCVLFACRCGDDHLGLVTETELDWDPLGLEPGRTFVNLMTSRHDDLSLELSELAVSRICAGEWPWSFFCYLEQRPRPVTPSSFLVLTPGGELRHEIGRVQRRTENRSDASAGCCAHDARSGIRRLCRMCSARSRLLQAS